MSSIARVGAGNTRIVDVRAVPVAGEWVIAGLHTSFLVQADPRLLGNG